MSSTLRNFRSLWILILPGSTGATLIGFCIVGEIMRKASFPRTTLRNVLLALVGAGACLCDVSGQTTIEPSDDSSAPVLLEVINRHFTVGKKIPSVFLIVSSDRTVQCHSWTPVREDTGVVKKTVLTPKEFEEVEALVGRPDLPKVKKRYELVHPVFDSWMEWDIKIQHPDGVQNITVANFSPEPGRGLSQPYPDALVMLGCSISKMRDYVCGDEPDWRRSNCGKVLQGK
jgi:hypothetical protein